LYGLLVDWVENGIEPGPLDITSPIEDRAPITYRIPAYPRRAIYTEGDPRIASSYAISD
jgi:hypothetical protein